MKKKSLGNPVLKQTNFSDAGESELRHLKDSFLVGTVASRVDDGFYEEGKPAGPLEGKEEEGHHGKHVALG